MSSGSDDTSIGTTEASEGSLLGEGDSNTEDSFWTNNVTADEMEQFFKEVVQHGPKQSERELRYEPWLYTLLVKYRSRMHHLYHFVHSTLEGALWFSGSCSRLVIRGSWVRTPLGAYTPRQGILSTVVSLDPSVGNGYPAGIYSFECS